MKRALVTGGAGFLGSFLAEALAGAGWEVTIFDRRESDHLPEGGTSVVGSILDREALAEAARGSDAVYHLAALADLERARDEPVAAAESNVLGTVHALEAARQAGAKRFVFASTVYVYSRAGGFYRCSKQAGESFVEEYQRRFGLPFTILRYGSLYGPRADPSNGVYRLLQAAAADGSIRHAGHADDQREYIHVEDAARLSVEILAPDYENQHLILTGPYPMRLGDLFVMFSEILGRDVEVRYEPTGPDHEHYRVTPYAFQPGLGRKLTSTCYVDMGQGLLQMLEEIRRQTEPEPGS